MSEQHRNGDPLTRQSDPAAQPSLIPGTTVRHDALGYGIGHAHASANHDQTHAPSSAMVGIEAVPAMAQRFAFHGTASFVRLGVAGGVLQIAAGLFNLRQARRGKGLLSWVAAAGLATSGCAQVAALLSCRSARVTLDAEGVAMRVGWLWRQRIPYSAIRRVGIAEFPLTAGFGIRTTVRDTVAVVLWGLRAVALELDPPRTVRVIGFRQPNVSQVWLGVEEIDQFIDALRRRMIGGRSV